MLAGGECEATGSYVPCVDVGRSGGGVGGIGGVSVSEGGALGGAFGSAGGGFGGGVAYAGRVGVNTGNVSVRMPRCE
ncbi:MAG: hypothetical protein AAF333_16720 [Planctomycetota bacterium]